MKIKTFQGASIQKALQLAKQDMGPDAVILETRELERKGFLGIGGRKYYELVVGVDVSEKTGAHAESTDRALTPKPPLPISGEGEKTVPLLNKEGLGEVFPSPSIGRGARGESLSGNGRDSAQKAALEAITLYQIRALQDEVRMMKQMVNQPRPVQSEVPADIVTLRKLFAGRTGLTNPGRAIIALIGPTGVGKTTTLAKLAAKYAIEEQKSVGLITLDTFRIGAVEQLRTYARILGVPLEVALTPEDLASSVNRFADKDVILIDTVGRCQKNKLQLAELQMYLDAAQPTEVHLVISASSSLDVQKDVIRNFGSLAPNRLIFTKLDEAVGLGCIADIAMATRLPISYTTNGQNVPDDIEKADPDKLASLVLEAAR